MIRYISFQFDPLTQHASVTQSRFLRRKTEVCMRFVLKCFCEHGNWFKTMGNFIISTKLIKHCRFDAYQMEIFSALLAICAGNSPVTDEFPAHRPVTRGFDVFFDLRLNKRLSKQWWGWWFETPPRPLWRHCNGIGLNKSTSKFDSIVIQNEK